MGKQSKQRKRALGRAKLALRKIIEITGIYYNDTRQLNLNIIAKSGLKKV